MAGVKQVLDNATAHDAKAKEPKAQLTRLDVLLPQYLAAGYLEVTRGGEYGCSKTNIYELVELPSPCPRRDWQVAPRKVDPEGWRRRRWTSSWSARALGSPFHLPH